VPIELPELAAVEHSAAELLREEEVAALATLSRNGYPSTSSMHIAADGLIVYLHTFVQTRKYGEMLRDPRVSYVVSHLPPGGFAARHQVRSLQVKGQASLVTEPDEVALAVELSRQQFGWLRDTKLYDHVGVPDEAARRVFFRINPVEAVWADHRVHLMWRAQLTFTADGRHIEQMWPYGEATGSGPQGPRVASSAT
jgi:nitroimidazol reductase NimA-like FMN-containing flavoprotein (pyridoxamine 5'-phosphate oxidase superfamily)